MRPGRFLSAVISVAVLLCTDVPAHASPPAAYVAASLNEFEYVLVNQRGVAIYVETIAATQDWSGCSLMGKSLESIVYAEGNTVTFPGSSQNCLLQTVRVLGNAFRGGNTSGPISAVFVAAMSGYTDPIVVDAQGTVSQLSVSPGCRASLADSVGRFVFMGAPIHGFNRPTQVFLFGHGETCDVKTSSPYTGTVTKPASYAQVLTDYEDTTWALDATGQRIPPPFVSFTVVPQPASPVPGAGTSSTPSQGTSQPATAPHQGGGEVAGASPSGFDDVSPAHFAAPYVKKLLASGVIQSGRLFHPDAPITRAEFAKLVVLARKTEVKVPPWPKWFSDVPANSSLAPYIYTIVSRTWATGTSGKFHPDKPITRLEAILIVQRAYSLPLAGPGAFSDVSGDDSRAVGAAQHAGIIGGDGGRFQPNRPITRAEAAKIVALSIK